MFEPGGAQKREKLILVGEAEHGRPRGQMGRRWGPGLAQGFEEYAVDTVPRWPLPPRDRRHPAAGKHARELRDRALGLREMAHAEVGDSRVEGSRLEGQRFGIGLAKLDPWMEAHGERDHLWRQVYADNSRGSSCSRGAGDGARARRHVEDAAARPRARGVEERPDRAAGHRLEEIVVAGGDPVVRGALEVPECLRVHGAPRA